MKKIKFLIITLIFSFATYSCSVIEDKICDVAIKEVNKEYDDWISELQNDEELSTEDKAQQIAVLNSEREEEISELKAECEDLL